MHFNFQAEKIGNVKTSKSKAKQKCPSSKSILTSQIATKVTETEKGNCKWFPHKTINAVKYVDED